MSFETSTEAKQEARWSDIIESEISAIETEIENAVSEGKFTTTVCDTPMTTPYNICDCDCEINGDGYSDNFKYEYYKVWKQEVENMPCQDAMNQVIKYFSDRKYAISRKTNPYTKNSFFWIVSWS
jgi:hypothetical protein